MAGTTSTRRGVDRGGGPITAEYLAVHPHSEAEFAIAIVDDYQGVGLGRLLMETLLLSAADAGLRRLIGYVLPDNTGAITLFRSLGARVSEADHGVLRAEIPLETESRTLRMSRQVRLGRSFAAAQT